MIYGLYLSASGVLANTHRQDVIANNLANSETVGFKRDLVLAQERRTEAQQAGLNPRHHSNPIDELMGGGMQLCPTGVDFSQGDSEETGNPMDVAILGEGFFAVREGKDIRMTRDGRFSLNARGRLVTNIGGLEVLDGALRPITLENTGNVSFGEDGAILQNGQVTGKVGLFDLADRSGLKKVGKTLLSVTDTKKLKPATGLLKNGWQERSNVDPAIELTKLMDAQRQLEANANMIRFQDQTLGRLVNEVAKIG